MTQDGLWRFVGRWGLGAQATLCALALATAAAGVAPIELQRRLIDDALIGGDRAALWTLGALYAAAITAQQALKFALRLGQARLAERVVAAMRADLLARWRAAGALWAGEAATILGAETEKLGGFVGAGPSGAVADAALLAAVAGYMAVVEPLSAAVALGLLAPQLVIAPLMQPRLDRLTAERVRLKRAFAATLEGAGAPALIGELRASGLALQRWKNAKKAALNLAAAAAPLGLLLAGGWLVTEGGTEVGVVIAFLLAQQRLAQPLRALIGFKRATAQARVQHGLIARWP